MSSKLFIFSDKRHKKTKLFDSWKSETACVQYFYLIAELHYKLFIFKCIDRAGYQYYSMSLSLHRAEQEEIDGGWMDGHTVFTIHIAVFKLHHLSRSKQTRTRKNILVLFIYGEVRIFTVSHVQHLPLT